MNIKTYIGNLDFDKYQLFYRQNKPSETTFLDISHKSLLLKIEDGQELSNGILNEGNINSAFQLIEESNDRSIIVQIANTDTSKYFPNSKRSIFDSALVFYFQGNIVSHLNLSLKDKLGRTDNDYPIDMSLEFVENVAKRLNELGTNPFKNYLPPSLSVLEQWRHYTFPFEIYQNPIFDVFEARTNSGLFAVNWTHAKVEIVPTNDRISIEQIKKIKYIEENRIPTRRILIDKFWIEYTKWKLEYELPELKQKEQLYQLIILSSIRIENDTDLTTHLYFRTWDEEHGQYVRYIDKENVEFV